ncbi:MAG: prolyl oligopeptidase family serine peptidase [Planctomycetota bacterium]
MRTPLKSILLISSVLTWAMISCSFADVTPEGASDDTEEPAVLTLDGLFNPSAKQKYIEPTKKFHWITDHEGKHVLLTLDEDDWKEVGLDNGDLKPWDLDELICSVIAKTIGNASDENEIRQRLNSTISSWEDTTSTKIMRLGSALIAIQFAEDRSSLPTALLVSSDASDWNDPTIDNSGRLLGYSRNGDMYVQKLQTGLTRRLTTDGSKTLLDGKLDWTYQEEIYGRGNYRGFWFSNDGRFLALLQTDISNIPEFVLSDSRPSTPSDPVLRYSFAGGPLPHAKLRVYDLSDFERRVPPAADFVESTESSPRLITKVCWSPMDNRLHFLSTDRAQGELFWRVADFGNIQPQGVPITEVIKQVSPRWFEPDTEIHFEADGRIFFTSQHPDGYNRVFQISSDGSWFRPVSPTNQHVRSFSVFPSGKEMYLRVFDGQTRQHRSGFVVLPSSDDSNQKPANEDGTRFNENDETASHFQESSGDQSVLFSSDFQHAVVTSSTASTPPELSLYRIDVDETKQVNTTLLQILDNPKLAIDLADVRLELISIASNGLPELPAMTIRPKATEGPIPVVVEIYGGPGASSVRDVWSTKRMLFRSYLARKGIATVVIDNRSSLGTGIRNSWEIDGKLGALETEETIAAARWIANQSWVDSKRMMIRGWSFGGFLTLSVMTQSEIFAGGIAGGSVTDWRTYDSIYTERYMGHPDDNQAGYDSTSVLQKADQLSGRLLMIHGEADDNVLPINTLRMAEALQKSGKLFDLMIYPGAAHSVNDPKQIWHMQQMITSFIGETLGVETLSVDEIPED